MVWNRSAVKQWESTSANLFAAHAIQTVEAVRRFGETDYAAGWVYALRKAHGRATLNLVLARAGLRKSMDVNAAEAFIARVVKSSQRRANEDFVQGMRDSLLWVMS